MNPDSFYSSCFIYLFTAAEDKQPCCRLRSVVEHWDWFSCKFMLKNFNWGHYFLTQTIPEIWWTHFQLKNVTEILSSHFIHSENWNWNQTGSNLSPQKVVWGQQHPIWGRWFCSDQAEADLWFFLETLWVFKGLTETLMRPQL